MQAFQIRHHIGKPARHRIPTFEGQSAKEEMEDRLVIRATGQEVPLGHGELVEVGEKRIASE
jgi:hypothetical protein